MHVIATAPGIDSRGIRQEIGSVFPCPRKPKKEDGSPGDEIVKASWYKEHREEDRGNGRNGDKKSGNNLVG